MLAVFVVAAAVYWRTAYPTITWFDSSGYSLASATLGVASPPGSVLLTLLGWPFTRITFGLSPAHMLNLLAGALAAITVALVFVVSFHALQRGTTTADRDGQVPSIATMLGAALGALTLAFADTLWEHAIKFTPYVLTALVTVCILWTLIQWWDAADQPHAWRWIALLALLFGLDFSVHRTNAMLMPGALAWIAMRRPRTLVEPRAVFSAVGAVIAGLAVQLLLIPIGRHTSSLWRADAPTNWASLWDYLSVARMGGGFLVQFVPRNSDLWSVQIADFLHVFRDNFFDGTVLGALPAIAGIVGIVALWKRERRFAVAFVVLLALHATTTVAYFNIPANFFRPFDRHYLPICVTFSIAIACGLGVVVRAMVEGTHRHGIRPTAGALAALLVLVVPGSRLVSNWSDHDASRRYFTRDFAENALRNLPPDAIFFTVGDNDTYPLLYLQDVEGVRRDVSVVNISMTNLPAYVADLIRRDPSFPIAMSQAERDSLSRHVWTSSRSAIAVRGAPAEFDLSPGEVAPDTIWLDTPPTYGDRVIPSDIVLLDILRSNRWHRPITFSATAGDIGWLQPLARADGLFSTIVPTRDRPPLSSIDRLRRNLLDSVTYRGFADPSVRVENDTRGFGLLYRSAFAKLLDAERTAGKGDLCRADLARLVGLVPRQRLNVAGQTPATALVCPVK